MNDNTKQVFVPGNLIRLNEQNRKYRYNLGYQDVCFLVLFWRPRPGLSLCRSRWDFSTNEFGYGWQILDQDGNYGWISEHSLDLYEKIQ